MAVVAIITLGYVIKYLLSNRLGRVCNYIFGSEEEMRKDTNVVWHHSAVTRQERERRNEHKSVILWFTGLSNSGKSTIAHAVEERLFEMGCSTFVFDGDNVRHGLCSDLSFSREDRVGKYQTYRRDGQVVHRSRGNCRDRIYFPFQVGTGKSPQSGWPKILSLRFIAGARLKSARREM